MDLRDAVALIESAVGQSRGVWADLGAGTGTFTRALATLLASGSRIYAVDRDRRAVAALRKINVSGVEIIAVQADFTQLDGSALGGLSLDGLLLANALHFASGADDVLRSLVRRLAPRGRVVVVEYDRRVPSRWIPFPISAADLEKMALTVGLSPFRVTATRPSEYAGMMYSATADRSSPTGRRSAG